MSKVASALLIIDLQRAFFEDPALAQHRTRLLETINNTADAARAADLPIFLVTTVHSRDKSTWTLNMLDDDQGFLFSGDDSTDIVEELRSEGMTRIEKTRDSAWLGTDLYMRLNNFGIGHVAVAGVSTHGCIAQTIRDAYAHNIRTTLLTDAVAGERDDYHDVAIEQLEHDRMTTLATAEQLRASWGTLKHR